MTKTILTILLLVTSHFALCAVLGWLTATTTVVHDLPDDDALIENARKALHENRIESSGFSMGSTEVTRTVNPVVLAYFVCGLFGIVAGGTLKLLAK
jgi:hypothetical protein